MYRKNGSGLYVVDDAVFAAGAGAEGEKAADDGVYGQNKPSPIPNPTNPPAGEPIPSPGGKPPEQSPFPDVTKPIPINTRDVEAELRGYLNSKKPELKKILYSTWNAQREAVKTQEIRNAIRDGEFSPQFLNRFREDYAKLIDEEFRPAWNDAINSSAEKMAEEVEESIGTFPRFNDQSARIQRWIETRGGELAVNLTKQQHRALRASIKYYTVENPVPADELGRLIRGQIGLTPRQNQAVINFVESLREDDNGLTAKQITERAQQYANRLWRQRGERIARTELAHAYNRGSFEQMRQLDKNELSDRTLAKEWNTAADEKVCDHCRPLDEELIGLEQTFPGATDRVRNTYTPPAHPNCRCTVIYVVMRRRNTNAYEIF